MSTPALLPLVLLLALPAGAAALAGGAGGAAGGRDVRVRVSPRARAAREARPQRRGDRGLPPGGRAATRLGRGALVPRCRCSTRREGASRPTPSSSASSGSSPQAGPGWAIRGVCAFDRGDFPDAIEWLHKGIGLGLGGNAELQRVARLRLAQALVKTGQFELAIGPLDPARAALAEPARPRRAPRASPCCGWTCCRRRFPRTDGTSCRSSAARASPTSGNAETRRPGLYAEAVSAYPDVPGVHYAYGVFLLRSGSDKGLSELRGPHSCGPTTRWPASRSPSSCLVRGDFAGARDSAMKAVELAPDALRRAQRAGPGARRDGRHRGGIRELEVAVRLAPDSAEAHFTLARAYAQGRPGRGRRARARRVRASWSSAPGRAPGTLRSPGPARAVKAARAALALLAGGAGAALGPAGRPGARPPRGPCFTDVTEKAGLRWILRGGRGELEPRRDEGGGGGFVDFDGDGWLDVYLVSYSLEPRPAHRPPARVTPSTATTTTAPSPT